MRIRPTSTPVVGAQRRTTRWHRGARGVAAAMLAILLCGVAPSASGAQEADGGDARKEERMPLIVVSGEGVVRAAPDRAFVSVAVEARDRDPKVAQQRNAEVMAAVQAKLRAAGIREEAIRTTGYELNMEADFVNGRRVPRGYLARNSVEVRLDEVARVGEIIDLAIAAGATDVTSVHFDLKDRASAQREAMRLAVADARALAEAAAAGAGLAIEGVQRIEQVGGPEFPRPMMRSMAPMMADAAPAGPSTPISAGEIEIRSQVRLSARPR